MIYNTVLILLVFKYFRDMKNMHVFIGFDKHLKKIIWFPVAMICCWILPSLYRIFQMAGYENFWVSLLHAICEGINGFVNTMIYAFNRKFREEMRNSFSSMNGQNFITRI